MKQLISLTCLLLLLSLPQLAAAEDAGNAMPAESEAEEQAQAADAGQDAEGKSGTAAEAPDGKTQEKDAADAGRDSGQGSRYAFLLNDNGYNYYMDTQNARWIAMPHTVDEQIIDVWIKLVPDSGEQQKERRKRQLPLPGKILPHALLPAAEDTADPVPLRARGRGRPPEQRRQGTRLPVAELGKPHPGLRRGRHLSRRREAHEESPKKKRRQLLPAEPAGRPRERQREHLKKRQVIHKIIHNHVDM
jgi:hypothetical protein